MRRSSNRLLPVEWIPHRAILQAGGGVNLILENVRLPFGPTGEVWVKIAGGRIAAIGTGKTPEPCSVRVLSLNGALLFPGLVNSHDHLEFNCFPALGRGPYRNFLTWSHDIHHRFSRQIERVSQIPQAIRAQWGVLKNLLCGVTVVAHHGALPVKPDVGPIGLVEGIQCLHSLTLERRWRWKLLLPELIGAGGAGVPVVVHLAEGVDEACRRELTVLRRWNWRRRPLIAVHGVALAPEQSAHLRALVWCPVSNRFLYGQTAPVAVLKSHTAVLLGSDATLTGSWNFWEHLRLARELNQLTDRELFEAVTARAAKVWGLPGGMLTPGASADLVVAEADQGDPVDAFFALNPEQLLLVLRAGRPVLWDATLNCAMLALGVTAGPDGWVKIRGRTKWVALNVAELFAHTPPELRPLPVTPAENPSPNGV